MNDLTSIFNVAKPLMNRLPIFKQFTKHKSSENYDAGYMKNKKKVQ